MNSAPRFFNEASQANNLNVDVGSRVDRFLRGDSGCIIPYAHNLVHRVVG